MTAIERLVELQREHGFKIRGVSVNHENPNLTAESVAAELVRAIEGMLRGEFEEMPMLDDTFDID